MTFSKFIAGKIRLQLKIAQRCIALYIGLHPAKVQHDHDSHLKVVTGHLDTLQIQELDGFATQDRHAIYLTALLHASLRNGSGSGTDLEGTTLVGDDGSVSSVGDSVVVGALIDQHEREHHHYTHETPAGGAESGPDMAAEAWDAQALQAGMQMSHEVKSHPIHGTVSALTDSYRSSFLALEERSTEQCDKS